MQHEDMERVHHVLVGLKPVARRRVTLEADVVVVGNDVPARGNIVEDVVGRETGLCSLGPR